ncbi:MAG: hypothetical protein FD180_3308 [Planctomycetota bacterium]|nr:MAG: hypothetical protein FD180_3308 [Planctomycetota bacterium]
MSNRKRMAIVPILMLLTSLPGIADDLAMEPEEMTRAIHLKSGIVIEAKVIEFTGPLVVVEFSGVPGSRGSVAQSSIVPADLFSLMVDNRDPKTAEDWIKLAKEAESLGLYADRIWSLRNAARLAPDRAREIGVEVEAARQECSKERLNRAKEFLEAGELERARRYLHTVMTEYCGCVAEEEGAVLMKEITDNIDRVEAKASIVVAARRKIQASQEDLRAVRELMDRGEDALRMGRGLLERPTNAMSRFDEAQALFERGWKLLGRFAIPASLSPELQEALVTEVRRLKGALRDDLVAVHLELGHAYLTRSAFVRATAHAGEAAALDAENPGVLALRIAIWAARSWSSR